MSAPSSLRGMHDLLPAALHPSAEPWQNLDHWHTLEQRLKAIFWQYGFQEIRTPILEETALFQRSIGEVTDIVGKEMFSFIDREKLSISLRPEGTVSVVRSGLQHGFLQQIQKLWYMGPMYRHERPQKGRLRQFHQVGVECFGVSGAVADAEIIALSAALLKAAGLDLKTLTLEINSIGSKDDRQHYRQALVVHFSRQRHKLNAEEQERLEKNPLRLLDSKNPDLKEIIAEAPDFKEFISAESQKHFAELQSHLTALHRPFVHNPRLVRGLDYYNDTVFEWTSTALGSQATVCAGGRYDSLVEQLGGKPTPAVGFALGIERLLLLVPAAAQVTHCDVYWVLLGEAAQAAGLYLAEQLREHFPKRRILLPVGGGNLSKQLKKAGLHGAKFVLILGEPELANNTLLLKHFSESEAKQEILAQAALIPRFNELFNDS
jgi:histidyl-tRNA synthetase